MELSDIVLHVIQVNTLIQRLLFKWVRFQGMYLISISDNLVLDVMFESFIELHSDLLELLDLFTGILSNVLVECVQVILQLLDGLSKIVVVVNGQLDVVE